MRSRGGPAWWSPLTTARSRSARRPRCRRTTLLEASWLLSGEGRFRWFHARPVRERDLEAAAVELTATSPGCGPSSRSGRAVVRRTLTAKSPSRLGDVALVAREPVAFLDPADTGETRLAARHGSLTAAEMYVPLLAFARR